MNIGTIPMIRCSLGFGLSARPADGSPVGLRIGAWISAVTGIP